MAREIPQLVRAAAGLAATVLDETRRLPALPVRLLGMAMQMTMRLQQQYAGLVARGDELLVGLRGADEPGLATFDEDEETGGPLGVATSAFDRVAETVIEVTDGVADEAPEEGADEGDAQPDRVRDELAIEELVDEAPAADGAAALENALLESDAGSSETSAADDGVDVLTPAGTIETVDATVTDEGVAAVEGSAVEGMAVEGVTPGGAAAEGTAAAPVADTPAIEGVAAAPPEGDTDSDTGGGSDTDTGGGTDTATDTPTDTGPTTLADDTRGDSPVTEDSPIAAATGVRTDVADVEPANTGASDEGTGDDGDAPRVAAATGVAVDVPGESPSTDAAGQGGQAVAGATGVAVDVGGEGGTAEEDAAREQGAAVNAVGADSAAPTDDPQGGGELAGVQAAGMAPVEGYDGFSIAQLRGHLRGYERSTAEELLAYEEATRNRDPYVSMLRNRLERLQTES